VAASHLERPKFEKVTPAHVTLRIANDIPSLRGSRRFQLIRSCFSSVLAKPGMRLVEIYRAQQSSPPGRRGGQQQRASCGMQGLCVRLARALNDALKRSGPVFADHFHSRLLKLPTEV
jgi:putative transposase